MKEEDKDLNYWKENAKDAYMTTPICVLRYITELEKAVKNNAVLPLVSGSACRELVECADCENRHFKDERVEKKKGAWTTYQCPKCGSENYCRI